MKYITRTIWILSLVSLFNDISSELLYPVMPLFLQSIGFSSVLIGLLEGFAEITAGFSKGYFGRLSDSLGKRMPFVSGGYLLSSIAKSSMAFFTLPLLIFGARSADKLGKGLRTGARDAILSDETTPQNKGKVFGFHRAFDTLGAAIGPSIALVFIIMRPGQYKLMFMLAFIPGVVGFLLTLLIKEKKAEHKASKTSFRLSQTFDYLKTSPDNYRKLMVALLLFALFNSSDLFLLMKIKATGLTDPYVIGCYILYNIVFALASFPLGHIADSFGLKKTMVVGLFLFALVYLGFGLNNSLAGFVILFVLYGIYAAATDGVSKALVSNVVPKGETGSAIGTYAGLSSIMAFLASTAAGLLWKFTTPSAVFLISAAGVFISMLYLAFVNISNKEIQIER
ncbi:MAG: transporter [Bacteroidota bacterium]|nr:transporter [Bacteroidota bacterium]